MDQSMTENWYLLFEGFSCDGRGEPSYVSRTSDYEEAKKFLQKNSDSPYHFDRVIVVTDFEYKQFHSINDLENWKLFGY